MGCAERRASTSQPGARRATRARCNSRVGVTVHELCRPTCPSARTRGSLAARPYRLHIPMRHLRTDEALHEPMEFRGSLAGAPDCIWQPVSGAAVARFAAPFLHTF